MGVAVYAVGGFVRDLLLGRRNADLDLVVEGNAIHTARNLAGKLGGAVQAHNRFGTARVVWPGGETLDLAMARIETYPRPGALPQVKPAGLREDLGRRDFTVNAMAVSLVPGELGNLIDVFGGREDLGRKRLRVLHARSFWDDPTRIIRAVRFEQRFGFVLEAKTRALLRQALREKAGEALSPTRLFVELWKVFGEPRPDLCWQRLQELKIPEWLHPGLGKNPEPVRRMAALVRATERLKPTSQGRRLLFLQAALEPLDAVQTEALAKSAQLPKVFREAVLRRKHYPCQA